MVSKNENWIDSSLALIVSSLSFSIEIIGCRHATNIISRRHRERHKSKIPNTSIEYRVLGLQIVVELFTQLFSVSIKVYNTIINI